MVVVATVSCIYGLGSPDDYRDMRVELEVGTEVEPRRLMRRLVALQYTAQRRGADARRLPQPG